MRDRRIQRHFLAYRDHGRADDLAVVFDACAPGLRALALHVLPTPQDADDVLQATFLAAMEHSRRFDGDQRVRPWLAGILVNQARRHVASESRAVRDEDVARPAAEDPLESARARELESRLDAALEDLAPRDREVLVPLLKRGDAPAAIARTLGVAPGTARVRIHRALARLRRVLPAGYAAAGAVAPGGLDVVRSRVVESARAIEPVGAKVGASATSSGANGLVVAALGFAVVAPLAWVMLQGDPSGAASGPDGVARNAAASGETALDLARVVDGEAPSRAILDATDDPLSVDTTDPIADASAALEAPGSEPTGLRVVGRIEAVDGLGGEATVAIVPAEADENGWVETLEIATFEVGGVFEMVSPIAIGRVVVVTDARAPAAVSFDGEDGAVVDVGAVTLDPGASVEGVAYGNEEAAEPVAGQVRGTVHFKHVEARTTPRLSLRHRTLGLIGERCFASSGQVEVDADDRFWIEGLEASEYDVIHVQRNRTPRSSMHDAEQSGTRVTAPAVGVELVSPMRGVSVVVTSGGDPVRDAAVKFSFPTGGSVSGPTDEDGVHTMILADNDRTEYALEISKPGFASVATILVPADIDDSRTLRVEIERTEPAARVELTLVPPGGPIGPFYMRLELEDSSFYVYRDFDDAPDTIDLGELPPGRYRGRIEPQVFLTRDPATLGRWRTTTVEFDCAAGAHERPRVELVAGGRLRLEVRDVASASSARWTLTGPGDARLRLLRWDASAGLSEESFGGSDLTADGTYWLERPLAPGEYTLTVPRAAGPALERRVHVVEGEVVTLDVDL